jgi:hypothetical protein
VVANLCRRRMIPSLVIGAAASSMLAGQVSVAEDDPEATQRQLTHSYCCIDYPRFIDMLQVCATFADML